MTRTELYRTLGGFDDRDFGETYNDVDFCLRVREAGQRVASLQLLRKIAARLGVDEEYLATGIAREHPYPAELVEADVALRLDDLDTARDLYERALKTSPEPRARAEALGGLGRLALRQGDPSQAVDSIEVALRLAPSIAGTSPGLVRILGKAYAERESWSRRSASSSALRRRRRAGDHSSKRAARSGLNAPSTAAASGGRRSCSEAPSREPASVRPGAARPPTGLIAPARSKPGRGGPVRGRHRLLELGETPSPARAPARVHRERARTRREALHGSAWLALIGGDAGPVETAQFRIEARALVLLGRNGGRRRR
jgi:tetratricopeptide (TPR) repeat protein